MIFSETALVIILLKGGNLDDKKKFRRKTYVAEWKCSAIENFLIAIFQKLPSIDFYFSFQNNRALEFA